MVVKEINRSIPGTLGAEKHSYTSPAQRQLGRSTRSIVLQIRLADGCATVVREKARKRAIIQKSYNKSATDLPEVVEGTPVLLRDFVSHKHNWKDATVVKRLSERSYLLDVDREAVRGNRQYFRPIPGDYQRDKQHVPMEIQTPDPVPQKAWTETESEVTGNGASSGPGSCATSPTTNASSLKTTRSGRVIRRPANRELNCILLLSVKTYFIKC